MQLFTLYYGKNKKRMSPIMVDSHHKCVNYMKAREHTTNGFHEIRPAEKGAEVWRQKSATHGGNKCNVVPRINRHGTTGLPGYIDKNGFNAHT